MSEKISGMAVASALTGTELMEVVQGGVNKQTTTQDIADLGGGGGGAVDSVNGQTGVVVLDAGDVGADPAGSASTVNTALSNHISDATDAHAGTAIANTPAGNIAATTVQAALNELDTEKQSATQVQTIADAKVADAINDGTTAVAPSQNAVFDALALKVDKETFATLTFASPTNWDQNNRQNPLAKVTATGSFTINMTNVKSGAQGILRVISSVGSTFILTFDTDFTNKDIISGATLTNYTFPNNTGFEYTCSFVVDGTTIYWIIGDYFNPTITNPYARVRKAATQAIPTADVTNAFSFDTEDIDNAAIFDAGSPTRLTVPGSGNKIATITVSVDFAVNTTGVRRIWFYKNGTGILYQQAAPVATVSTTIAVTAQLDCAAGDYWEIRPYQNSGGNLNATAYVTIKIESR